MKFSVLWSGLVSPVGLTSHRVNLMHLSPLDRNAQEKNYYDYDLMKPESIYFGFGFMIFDIKPL